MAGGQAAIEAFTRALAEPAPESREALLEHLTGDVQVLAAFGVGAGPGAVEHLLSHALVGRVVTLGAVGGPAPEGDLTVIDVTAPATMPIGGLRFAIHLDADGRIDRVEQDLIPAEPREPEAIALTEEHARLLGEALDNGTPVIVGYVDAGGRPHLSYRATVQVLGPDRLAMWVRDPEGGLARALTTNPHLSCFYSDRKAGVTLQFLGRGHVESDEDIRHRTFEGSPKAERDMDWRRHGVAVVIDLDRVEGRDSGGRVLMARPESS